MNFYNPNNFFENLSNKSTNSEMADSEFNHRYIFLILSKILII